MPTPAPEVEQYRDIIVAGYRGGELIRNIAGRINSIRTARGESPNITRNKIIGWANREGLRHGVGYPDHAPIHPDTLELAIYEYSRQNKTLAQIARQMSSPHRRISPDYLARELARAGVHIRGKPRKNINKPSEPHRDSRRRRAPRRPDKDPYNTPLFLAAETNTPKPSHHQQRIHRALRADAARASRPRRLKDLYTPTPRQNQTDTRQNQTGRAR